MNFRFRARRKAYSPRDQERPAAGGGGRGRAWTPKERGGDRERKNLDPSNPDRH